MIYLLVHPIAEIESIVSSLLLRVCISADFDIVLLIHAIIINKLSTLSVTQQRIHLSALCYWGLLLLHICAKNLICFFYRCVCAKLSWLVVGLESIKTRESLENEKRRFVRQELCLINQKHWMNFTVSLFTFTSLRGERPREERVIFTMWIWIRTNIL